MEYCIQGPDFWCWFDTTQFSYIPLCSPNTCKYVFNPNVSQIVPRVCTLVLSLTLGAHARGLQYSFCLSVCLSVFNPRRACARVTVLVLSVCVSVCLCVCFPYSGTSRNQAYKQQYQRLQRDTGMKYKKGFFFKTLRSEVMASFTHLE